MNPKLYCTTREREHTQWDMRCITNVRSDVVYLACMHSEATVSTVEPKMVLLWMLFRTVYMIQSISDEIQTGLCWRDGKNGEQGNYLWSLEVLCVFHLYGHKAYIDKMELVHALSSDGLLFCSCTHMRICTYWHTILGGASTCLFLEVIWYRCWFVCCLEVRGCPYLECGNILNLCYNWLGAGSLSILQRLQSVFYCTGSYVCACANVSILHS